MSNMFSRPIHRSRRGSVVVLIPILFASAALILIGFISGATVGQAEATHRMQVEAVKRGFAEWSVKPDGKTEFKWREVKP